MVQFRVCYDRWGLASIWSNIFTNSNKKKTCLLLSIVYIQISNSYFPEFLNSLLYVDANPVWMCH